MYIPDLFQNKNPDDVKDFISANSFAIMISQGNSKLMATHIPLLLHKNRLGDSVLLGHIARANQQLKDVKMPADVLVIFQGPHSYISSSWYDHENVPTWNYVAVHVYGTLKTIEGEELLQALDLLVNKFEAASQQPASVKNISKNYMQQHMKGIIGFEIKIESIEAAKKLSQNRDDKNYHQIIDELEKRPDEDSHKIAGHMKKLRPKI